MEVIEYEKGGTLHDGEFLRQELRADALRACMGGQQAAAVEGIPDPLPQTTCRLGFLDIDPDDIGCVPGHIEPLTNGR